jgi:hypothetical protein
VQRFQAVRVSRVHDVIGKVRHQGRIGDVEFLTRLHWIEAKLRIHFPKIAALELNGAGSGWQLWKDLPHDRDH